VKTSAAISADVVVVGTGPGGATVGRELARRGGRVVFLERGVDHRPRRYYGTYLGAALCAERGSLLFTKEGLNVIRPLMVGGATSMFCGCAAPPPDWLRERYGIELEAHVAEAVEELEVAPLPRELRGEASTRLADAAGALGYEFEPQPKFVRPARARPFDCGASCMLGCRCGAKWNAAEFVDDAVAAGAALCTRARIDRVLREGGHAVGVEGTLRGAPLTVRAETVILAAGGIGTPRILQASGLPDAGRGMAMDVTVIVYGTAPGRGNGTEPPMTWSWEDPEVGSMLSTLVDPWLSYPVITGLRAPRRLRHWPHWNRLLGLMVKLRDDISGGVAPDGTISKPLSSYDRDRLRAAVEICRAILREAGADPRTVFTSPLRGTHPSGTVRIGTMLDLNLQTAVEGLYVCDASAFPEALGRPTVLTIIALAKRLAAYLLQDDRGRLARSPA
jgi:choline dehydrogenase-like flavoprotein